MLCVNCGIFSELFNFLVSFSFFIYNMAIVVIIIKGYFENEIKESLKGVLFSGIW